MFFELHNENKIGYKKLTNADLGFGNSHQTHIGLYENILDFLPNRDVICENSIFIYKDNLDYIDAYFDRIETPSGSYRSPKIKTGGQNCVSIVSQIRHVVKTEENNSTWYLFWFGLKNKKIVFCLIEENSDEYINITRLGLDLTKSGEILDDNHIGFKKLLNYFENIINKQNEKIIKDLEIYSQTHSIPDIINEKITKYDIERANENFRLIGRTGEELVNKHLESQLANKQIENFHWANKDKESGQPYDFTIQLLNSTFIYLDVKTTNFGFDQEMIFSSQEIDFMSKNMNYSIYRVYKDSSTNNYNLRICDNCQKIAHEINELTKIFKYNLSILNINLESTKLSIPTSNKKLNFKNSEIQLNNH